MKKLLFYLFILCSTSIVAQNGITFEVEQLSKPEKLYPVASPDEIYRYLMLFDNESTIRITEKDIWKPPFNVIAKSESPDSLLYFGYNSFFCGMYQAYADHRPFVLSPDMIWLLINQGFAQHVNANHESLRKYFVNFSGKESLIVQSNKKLKDPSLLWEEIFPQFTEQIRKEVGGNLVETLTCNFSTTTSLGYPDFRMKRSYALEHNLYLGAEQTLSKALSLTYGARITVFRNVGKALLYSYDQNYDVSGATEYGSGKIYHTYIRPEFRAGAVYKLDDYSSVKANFTHNTQFIQMANNSDSGSPLDLWFPASPNIKPQEANQYSVGYFRNFNNNSIETSVEFYYKGMNNVIDFKDNAQILFNEKLEGEIRTGKGKSYGMEIMVKKNTGRLTGFVNYTLAHTDRTIPGINQGKTYLAPNDKTHSVNILASYNLTKKWDVSAEWVFSTGTPVTYPTGRFEINGEYYPIYSGKSKERKEPYHRLDISATYRPNKHPQRWYQGEWVFSIYNAYWHKNPWMTSFDQNTTDGYPQAKMTYLFGAVPSVTYNFKF